MIPLSQEEFEALTPYERGFAVYMAGNREDQPNVPNETNPYPVKTREHKEWERGQFAGVLEAQDSEE